MTWIVVVLSLNSPGLNGVWIAERWFGPYTTEDSCKVAADEFEKAFEGPQSVVAICVEGRRTTEE